MASADADMRIHEEQEQLGPGQREAPSPPRLIRYYQASQVLPEEKVQLHSLLQKQPAVLGSLQVMSGFLSVGVGILFAVTRTMQMHLLVMFRVSHFTGFLYIIAGVLSNLLFKYPALVTVSFAVNCGCIIVAVTGAVLISVDLAFWHPEDDLCLRMELMQLCMLGFEVLLSVILCFWFIKEKPAKSA